MSFWLTTQAKFEISLFLLRKSTLRVSRFFELPIAKAVLLTFAAITAIIMMATPVFADTTDVTNNIVVYDDREKILKIAEISLSHDYTSMSVLVENIQTKANFRIEHELNTEDTLNEHIEITATDGMGNVSETVNIKNPFYVPEIADPEPEPEPIKGSLSVTGSSDVKSEMESEPTSAASTSGEITPENGGFDTSGWSSVVDNAVSGNKEFLILRSESGSEFYIVIDRENDKDNVYFLNSVTEWDLLGLAEKYEVPNNLSPDSDLNNIVGRESFDGNPASQETQENAENQNEKPTAEAPKQGSIGVFGIIALILFVAAVGAYFYFFKFKRKIRSTNNDDFLPDNYGEYDDEDEDSDSAEDEGEEYDEDEDDELESPASATESDIFISKSEKEIDSAEKDVGVADNYVGAYGDAGDTEEDVGFTDEDVGDTNYNDYEGEIDEDEVLGVMGGDADEEDEEVNTV